MPNVAFVLSLASTEGGYVFIDQFRSYEQEQHFKNVNIAGFTMVRSSARFVLLASTCSSSMAAFYLPGVAPKAYATREKVGLK